MYKIQKGTPPNVGCTIKASYKNFLITAVFKGDKPREWGNGITNANNYKVTVKNTKTGAKTKFNFWASIAKPKIEKEYDVLNAFYCFVSDSVSGGQSFEEFCDELGYNTNSITARKTWKACKKSLLKLGNIYDGDIYTLANELSEIAG